jgi:hypothetical protein
MSSIALLLAAIALPTAAGYGALLAVRAWRRLAEARCQAPPAEATDRLAARLRRLRAELESAESSPKAVAKQHHVRAVRGAYLDSLAAACGRLGVAPPAGGDRVQQAEIYRVEAALRQRGLDVRATASQ